MDVKAAWLGLTGTCPLPCVPDAKGVFHVKQDAFRGCHCGDAFVFDAWVQVVPQRALPWVAGDCLVP